MPLGAHWVEEERAYNFSIYSHHARAVKLLFYDEHDQTNPCFEFALDRLIHKTTQLWHCRLPVEKLCDARYYAYQMDGPSAKESGWKHAFDPEKILLDPYAKRVFFPPAFDRTAAREPGSNAGKAPLVVLADEPPFDWGDDKRPRHRDVMAAPGSFDQ